MRKSWLMCVLLGAMAWGQAAPATPQAAPAAGMPKPQAPTTPPDTSASVPADAPVITIHGVCPAQPKPAAAKGTAATPAAAAKPAATNPADCKTVYTKAEFEKLANGVAPNITPQLKKQLASVLPRFVAMSTEAKKRGLDKTPQYDEMLKFVKMQILTQELTRRVQDEAAKVPQEDIATYYKENSSSFEQYSLDRLFVPRSKQPEAEPKEEEEKDEKLTDEQKKAKEAEEKAKSDAAEEEMTKLATTLRDRAAAGEEFAKLQKEAFEAAGMKIESPTVTLPKVRRTGLPPAHSAVFELKPGEVSQVISDSGGHYIYKIENKDQLPLDQVKDEIHNTLQNQRSREMMDKLNGSFKVDTNEAYFGPGGPQVPQRMPNPRMMPGQGQPPQPRPQGAATPAPAPQAPAPAQPPAAQPPAAKPN